MMSKRTVNTLEITTEDNGLKMSLKSRVYQLGLKEPRIEASCPIYNYL